MAAEVGCWVRWGKETPMRLGYGASDLGRVIAIREGRPGGRELDVQFPDGGVIRGAFEQWFEKVRFGTEGETEVHTPLRPAGARP